MCPATAAASYAALSSHKAKQYQQFGPMKNSLFSPELYVCCINCLCNIPPAAVAAAEQREEQLGLRQQVARAVREDWPHGHGGRDRALRHRHQVRAGQMAIIKSVFSARPQTTIIIQNLRVPPPQSLISSSSSYYIKAKHMFVCTTLNKRCDKYCCVSR